MAEDNGKTHQPRVCVDLDGVLNLYDGWKGEDHFAELRPGATEFLQALNNNGFSVVVLTSRDPVKTLAWLTDSGMVYLVDKVTNKKIPAIAYVDDRAVRFTGDFGQTFMDVARPPHWHPDANDPVNA